MLKPGDTVSARTLRTITDTDVAVPAPDATVHLQFRRFAGCPICTLHMHELSRRHDEIESAGITEITVFHSAADALRRYQADLPFAVVADPDRKLYKEFGVESSSIAASLHPRAMLAAARGMRWSKASGAIGLGEKHTGKPADFLIGSDGSVLACKYGAHADDQWSVDELLKLAKD
ncbi:MULTISPECIES: peroxiredoxin-like family protein [unclassified Mycobacterium]|uniref:peroxiredoxin-like family protein n=1 Tax=unclassified Mycobacterium TaxID=2642494 RepID=UPI00096F02D1|nr:MULTISPECIES: peroxiredoxin-like family protein [unclassified Mycobacterium]OMC13618.1 alkyl hydroperoxide reductase [Mycobacterium sp. SP-6446]OMC57810.1 alkyl hydroperoxide reductase [Mycobacterium sp. IS-836]